MASLIKPKNQNNTYKKLDCKCHSCLKERDETNGLPYILCYMIVCPDCGSKKCPKATYHGNSCTLPPDKKKV